MKIILVILTLCNLLFANSQDDIKKEIAEVLMKKKALDNKLNLLKSKLIQKVEEESFITHTEFGYTKTSGNTDTESFNLDTEVKKRWGKHVGNFHIDAQYAEDKNVKTKNKYLVELQYDYDLTSKLALDFLVGYKDDEFSTYDYQFYLGPGLSYMFINNNKYSLKLDGNILFSEDKTESIRNYISFMSKATYSLQILDNLKFKQILSYRLEASDKQNYFIYSKTSFSTKLSKIFSAGISYKYDYVNVLTTGINHNDDTFSIDLIVDY